MVLNENSIYSISYYLEKTLPKGGIVCAIYPKKILQKVLPQAARNKGCKVQVLHGTKEAVKALLDANVLQEGGTPDLYITEPDAIVEGGVLVKPEEIKLLSIHEFIAISSEEKVTKENPASHDFIPTNKIITEKGINASF